MIKAGASSEAPTLYSRAAEKVSSRKLAGMQLDREFFTSADTLLRDPDDLVAG